MDKATFESVSRLIETHGFQRVLLALLAALECAQAAEAGLVPVSGLPLSPAQFFAARSYVKREELHGTLEIAAEIARGLDQLALLAQATRAQ